MNLELSDVLPSMEGFETVEELQTQQVSDQCNARSKRLMCLEACPLFTSAMARLT